MTREELAKISAERINMMKNAHDVTYREIERATGIAHTTLCSITKGEHVPNGYAVAVLSEYFGVSADFLLGLSDEMGRAA